MRPLSAAELLTAWEKGLSEPSYRRALALLSAACPDISSDELAALSIGERDRYLLLLREWTFGAQLVSVANCSACGEPLEWTVSAADLRVAKQAQLSGDLSLKVDHYRIGFRLPNTLDLAAVADCPDTSAARSALLERCVLTVRRGDQEIAAGDLPAAVADAIVKRMAEADPQADMQLDLSCPACGHRWRAWFDIESFFWSEINAWAQRILAEVHTLASAYGWRESDILNLSPWRRQFYIGLVGG
jgi:hypothetical protein